MCVFVRVCMCVCDSQDMSCDHSERSSDERAIKPASDRVSERAIERSSDRASDRAIDRAIERWSERSSDAIEMITTRASEVHLTFRLARCAAFFQTFSF